MTSLERKVSRMASLWVAWCLEHGPTVTVSMEILKGCLENSLVATIHTKV